MYSYIKKKELYIWTTFLLLVPNISCTVFLPVVGTRACMRKKRSSNVLKYRSYNVLKYRSYNVLKYVYVYLYIYM